MNYVSLFLTVPLMVATASTALALENTVSRSLTISDPDGVAWKAIGDFCDIDDWHPGIADCELQSRDGAVHRLLTLGNGATVLEKLISFEPGESYTYSILEAPHDFGENVATLSITEGDRPSIHWAISFATNEPGPKEAITGVYEAGLAALEEQLAQ